MARPTDETYAAMSPRQLDARIEAAKAALGSQVVILGHHYQREEVIRHADLTGDSLKLSQLAAQQTAARYIVFCGVHFMAESADLLAGADQTVVMPCPQAGCPMAAMADADDVRTALEELTALAGGARIVPVTYVNSSAAVKAVTGAAGGACCTSSNARGVLEWALRPTNQGGAGAEKVLAVPDQHLARATALDMGYTLDDCALYDPDQPDGGLDADAVAGATFLLWKGFCNVHQRFCVADVERVRREQPGVTVIVHPECDIAVVQAADLHGSTEQIIRAVSEAGPGTAWAVGTEGQLVNRLARRLGDRTVVNLSQAPQFCYTMSMTDLASLARVLDALADGQVVNEVAVPERIAADARLSLERMVALKAGSSATRSL